MNRKNDIHGQDKGKEEQVLSLMFRDLLYAQIVRR
ncbi:MAG: hypothetical protein G01um101493_156 [Microgenomates group bacterium Gr01-1014_93]|nr:MAG: hypothetical protein G01um101493_156 [Microgenomates group bacterium Gr01-1014_93]